MTCQRCKGFMYYGFLAEPNGIYIVRKCVNCGEILDEVIASNRVQPLNARVRKRRPLWRKGTLKLVSSTGRVSKAS